MDEFTLQAPAPPTHGFLSELIKQWRAQDIHVDGLLKDPSCYEALSPQTFGRVRRIVLGKHSGMASVACALQSLGLFTDASRTKNVLAQVKERSNKAKRVIQDDELLDFYRRASDTEILNGASMEMRYDCA